MKLMNFKVHFLGARDQPKFGFAYGAETGDIFSFGYGCNHDARFRPSQLRPKLRQGFRRVRKLSLLEIH